MEGDVILFFFFFSFFPFLVFIYVFGSYESHGSSNLKRKKGSNT